MFGYLLSFRCFLLFSVLTFLLADALVKSLQKLVLGGEQYGSRPCMTIDVCSERQVQLALEVDSPDTSFNP